MLEKPDIPDGDILTRLLDDFRLQVSQVTFLPLGADINTAVYRVVTTGDGRIYFLKLRKGASPGAWGASTPAEELTVWVPRFLHSQGIQAIIAPLETQDGQPWAAIDAYKMILYPYIEGKDGYEVALTDGQWVDFGGALQNIHSVQVPPELARLIPRETFSSTGREIVKNFQAQVAEKEYRDPEAAQMAAFMKVRRGEINYLVRRAGELSLDLRAQPPEFVLCHSDVHPGNLLVGTAGEEVRGKVFIVDWDTPLFAPKERDLMLIGGCVTWNSAREEDLFYLGYAGDPGYAREGLDPTALIYYRYERIVQDIAEFCQQLLGSDEGSENREQSLEWFQSMFTPGHEVDLAITTDKLLMGHEDPG